MKIKLLDPIQLSFSEVLLSCTTIKFKRTKAEINTGNVPSYVEDFIDMHQRAEDRVIQRKRQYRVFQCIEI